MTQRERNILDKLVEIGRELLEDIDRALSPKSSRQPARVPVPVRSDHPRPQRNPYDQNNRY